MPELTTEEQAYFDSGGTKELPEEVAATEAPAEQGETESTDTGQTTETTAAATAESDGGEKPEAARDEKGKFVPHGAFHEERERRKAAEERARRIEEQVLNRLTAMEEKRAAPAPQVNQERVPSIAAGDDPLEVIAYQERRLAALESQRAEETEQRSQQTEQQRESQRIRDHVASQVEVFKGEHPDYEDAYKFAVEARVNELRTLGATNSEIQQAVMADEQSIVYRAMQSGKNPAELLYAYAAARGYKKADAAAEAGKAAEKIDAVAQGQQQNRSLGQAAGGANPPPSLETLANMNDDEFYKAVQSGQFKKVMGG